MAADRQSNLELLPTSEDGKKSEFTFFSGRTLQYYHFNAHLGNPDWIRKKILDFVLHHPRYEKATILVAGKNFGCGSSREHAVWALADYGFHVVIASSFADIFANNSLKNGLLTVRLTEEQVAEIVRRAKESENYRLTIDLEKLCVDDGQGFSATFAMDEFSRHCLLNGLDDIGLTLQHESAIEAYEGKHPVRSAMRDILAG